MEAMEATEDYSVDVDESERGRTRKRTPSEWKKIRERSKRYKPDAKHPGKRCQHGKTSTTCQSASLSENDVTGELGSWTGTG